MKKQLILAGSIVLTLACTKAPKIQPQSKQFSNNSETNHNASLRESPVKGNRVLHRKFSGGEMTEIWCHPPAGSCLDDIEIIEANSEVYANLLVAIETKTQEQFFSSHNYAEIYGIDHNDWVQEGLVSEELKIVVVSKEGIDYHVFTESQYVELPLEQGFEHMSFVVPVNN